MGDIHICEVPIEQTNPCWHLGIRTNRWRNGVCVFCVLVTAASGNDIDVCLSVKWDVFSTFGSSKEEESTFTSHSRLKSKIEDR